MKYLVVDFMVKADAETRQIACDLIASETVDAGFESFVETEEGLQGYVQEDAFNRKVLDVCLVQIPVKAEISYKVSEMEDKDWNAAWEEAGFSPIHVGDKCVIYDARHTDRNAIEQRDGCLNLFIETTQAFGTGTHQTTQMMVANVLERVKEGTSVLDFGCGTGILGIVASKCGALSVLGYDIDQWSVDNTKHNAKLNGVKNMEVMLGDSRLLDGMEQKYDVVLANINRNIVVTDMPLLKDVMKPSALLMTSGFFEEDIAIISQKAHELGLKEIHRQSTEGWACVVYQRVN